MSVLYRLFFAVAIAEACSWLGLLGGMYVKYLGSGDEIGVKIFGPVHGILFVAYVALVLLLAREHSWSKKKILVGLACSIPPLASVVFERWVDRDRRAKDPEPVPA